MSRADTNFGVTRIGYVLAFLLATAIYLVLLADPAQAQADLSITKDGPETVRPGQRFTYELVVSNDGEDEAEPVTVQDRLPSGTDFLDSQSESICNEADPTTDDTDVVNCAVPRLQAGQSRPITLTVTAPETPGNITNQATARSDDDPDSPADSNQVTTRVVPNVVISKRDDPNTVSAEGRLIYTLRVENQSNRPVENIRVRDDLPVDRLNIISVSSNGFQCENRGSGLIVCTGELALNGDGTVTIVVEPEETGTIRNSAEVFVNPLRRAVDRDTEETTVRDRNGSNQNENPDDGNNGNDGDNGDDGRDLDDGCTTLRQFEGDEQVSETFNFPDDSNRLRIVYATADEDGELDISIGAVTGRVRGVDETITGAESGVFTVNVNTEQRLAVSLDPTDQTYRVAFEAIGGDDDCTSPEDLRDVLTNNNDDDDDDILNVPDDELPDTGGVPLSVLAGCAALLLVCASLIGASAVRRGR